jgi:hypothetical protein
MKSLLAMVLLLLLAVPAWDGDQEPPGSRWHIAVGGAVLSNPLLGVGQQVRGSIGYDECGHGPTQVVIISSGGLYRPC